MAIICPKKQLTFQEHSLKKTLTFEKQILSQDKYVNIFVHQMEPIVFIIHKYLSTHVQFWKLGNITWIFCIFIQIMHLDQSCVCKTFDELQ